MIAAGIGPEKRRCGARDLALEVGGKSLGLRDAQRPRRIERGAVGGEGLKVDFIPLGVHRRQHGATRRLLALGSGHDFERGYADGRHIEGERKTAGRGNADADASRLVGIDRQAGIEDVEAAL